MANSVCMYVIMDFAPWQRTSSHIVALVLEFGQKQSRNYASTIVFAGLGPR